MDATLKDFPETVRRCFAALLKCEYGEVTISRAGEDYVIESPPGCALW